jgi:hypothetical protein
MTPKVGRNITAITWKLLIRAYVEPEYIQYLRYRFSWPNKTIEIIAWKCLSLAAIQRINRDVLITKVCSNDLLPTADTLCSKMRYQHHDTCKSCHQHETRDYIIRCTAPSRIRWRQQYIYILKIPQIFNSFNSNDPSRGRQFESLLHSVRQSSTVTDILFCYFEMMGVSLKLRDSTTQQISSVGVSSIP